MDSSRISAKPRIADRGLSTSFFIFNTTSPMAAVSFSSASSASLLFNFDSRFIKSFSNASLLGISPKGHRQGFWEMEDDILSYFSLNNNRLGDVNFHMGFIKKPNNNPNKIN